MFLFDILYLEHFKNKKRLKGYSPFKFEKIMKNSNYYHLTEYNVLFHRGGEELPWFLHNLAFYQSHYLLIINI